jgi:phenylacetate-CoA ligase
MIRNILNKVYGSSMVGANLRGQRSIPYLPEEKLGAIRDKHLREIVRYAAETVPCYRDLFHKEGIDPDSIKAVLHSVNYRLDTLAHPRVLITSSGIRDEFLIARIKDTLEMEVFDFYGANEVGRIAWECPAHEGLHLNGDHLVFECLNSSQPAEAGIPGEVIVTSLNVWAQPYIRYRLGDNCVFKGRPCSCGSAYPLISAPLGRSNDLIRLPSGKILSADPLEFILRKVDSIEQFRIVQESIGHLVLQLVFRKAPDNDLIHSIRSRVLESLAEPVRVDIQCVDFVHDANSKFRTFVSNLPDEADPLRSASQYIG